MPEGVGEIQQGSKRPRAVIREPAVDVACRHAIYFKAVVVSA